MSSSRSFEEFSNDQLSWTFVVTYQQRLQNRDHGLSKVPHYVPSYVVLLQVSQNSRGFHTSIPAFWRFLLKPIDSSLVRSAGKFPRGTHTTVQPGGLLSSKRGAERGQRALPRSLLTYGGREYRTFYYCCFTCCITQGARDIAGGIVDSDGVFRQARFCTYHSMWSRIYCGFLHDGLLDLRA